MFTAQPGLRGFRIILYVNLRCCHASTVGYCSAQLFSVIRVISVCLHSSEVKLVSLHNNRVKSGEDLNVCIREREIEIERARDWKLERVTGRQTDRLTDRITSYFGI